MKVDKLSSLKSTPLVSTATDVVVRDLLGLTRALVITEGRTGQHTIGETQRPSDDH
jgi:hypothetical protein